MKVFDHIINNAVNIYRDINRYSPDEKQYIMQQIQKANYFRMNILSFFVILLQSINIFLDYFTHQHPVYYLYYIGIDTLMIVVIGIHQLVYFFYIRKRKQEELIYVKYLFSWIFCFSAITLGFHAADIMEKGVYDNFFALLAVVTIVPIMNTIPQIIYVSLLLSYQLVSISLSGGVPGQYQWSIAFALGAFALSRLLYYNFVRMTGLNWRLKHMNKELENQNNRYSILQKLTRETIFEYNFSEDIMIITDATKDTVKTVYNYVQKTEHRYQLSAKEDMHDVLEAYQDILNGKKRDSAKFCTKEKDGNLCYKKAIFTTIYNAQNNPVSVIGKIYKLQKEEVSKEST